MTTYSYTLTLNDSEMITLQEALEMMAKHCDRKLKDGARAPFFAWRMNVEQIQARMFANTRQTSGSGVDPETGEYSIWCHLPGRAPENSKQSMVSRFVEGLHSLLPKPCYGRPFVCVGSPEACKVILIGENPATTMGVDWWDFWSDSDGFDFKRWDAIYRISRREQGKTEVSQTRLRILRLRTAGVTCLETNAFMNERLQGHGQGLTNSGLLDLAINSLPNVSEIIAHGNEAQAYVGSQSIPSHLRVFHTKHFRLMSYAAIDSLAAAILKPE